MFDKLEEVEKRYDELTKMISDPEVIANQNEWQQLMKEHSSMQDVIAKYKKDNTMIGIDVSKSKSTVSYLDILFTSLL